MEKTDSSAKKALKRGPIIVARHGRPALDRNKGPKLDWREYIDWWAAYEEGGLKDGQDAPEKLKTLVADADVFLTSVRLRAQQTMAFAAPGKLAHPHEIFNEAPLPPPRFRRAKFLPKTWNVLARIAWMMGHSLDGESAKEARSRAGRAAQLLHDESEAGKVFLAAHGWFNRMMREELEALGWKCIHNGGNKYWSWRAYEYREQ